MGGAPGPFGVSAGSGEQAAGLVEVELWVDGQWLIITPYVMTRDGSQQIVITGGQQNEASALQPGRCSFQLNNRDGRFSPRNPLSPLYGKIGRNTPIRISVPLGNDKSYRFWGEVPEWPQAWDTTGNDVWVDVSAAGPMRRLGQGDSPIGSAMRVALAGGETANTVVAYWPFEDAAGSTTIGSAVTGVPAMGISGTPTLATNSEFVCSGPLPTMGSASFTALVPAYTAPGGFVDATNPFSTLLRFLVRIPQAGATTGQILASFTWTGSPSRWEVYYSTASSGQIGLRGRDSTGAVTLDTGVGGPAMNGTLAHVQVGLDITGGILFEYGLSILTVGSTSPTTVAGSSFGPTNGIVTAVTIAQNRGLTDTVIGHVSLQMSPAAPTDTAAVALAIAAYAGETAAARIQRLCGVADVAYELIGTASDTVAMGAQLSSSVLSLISDAVTADGGRLYERTTALGLGYRTRVSLENQAAALAMSYTANNLAEVPVPQDDDTYTRNDITVSRTGGSSARATLTTGALSIADPPNGVGRYDDSVTVNVQSDTSLPDQAGWRLHLGTTDEPRYPKLSINLAHPSITGSTTIRAQALALRVGDRITISDPPAWLPPGPISQLMLGSTETIDNFQHRLAWNAQPESAYRVAVADHTDFGRADTDGSRLAADASPTGTALSVATTSGPTWVTDLSETPFDLAMGGEVVTVVAVGTQLAANPLLLTDLTGWTAQNSTIARDTTIINSGRDAVASMLITPNGSSASGGALGDPTAVGTITPAATYKVSMWAYSPAGWSDLRPCIDWADSGGVFLSTGLGSATSVSAGTWTYIEQTLTAPALASQATPRARYGGTPAATDIWYAWAVRLVPSASIVSTSPQTMTVVRSVNGIVKPQAAGTDVSLAQPAIAAL
jgi:hypothetical protein